MRRAMSRSCYRLCTPYTQHRKTSRFARLRRPETEIVLDSITKLKRQCSTISDTVQPRLSTPFPSGNGRRNAAFRVSRIGFGSPWFSAPGDRTVELSDALSDARVNLVQLGSKVTPPNIKDFDGKMMQVDPDDFESWEGRAFREHEIERDRLGLILSLDSTGFSVEEALDPSRALEQLDKLLEYHGIEWLDSFLLEIPSMKGGEEEINDYRRLMGLAVQNAMREVVAKAGDKISTLGFSWKSNPHAQYPGREPDSPLSDVIELRDMVMPNKPLVVMFPVGVGCGERLNGWATPPNGRFDLPADKSVFQIGTSALHAHRPDGAPFRFIDVSPRPTNQIMAELKKCFDMTIHLELQYKQRFESQEGGQQWGAASGDKADSSSGEMGAKNERQKEQQPVKGPLPHRADVCWAHIMLQHQHQIKGLDEWETIRDTQIKPTVNAAVETLRAAGTAPGEWGYLYRSTLGTLLDVLTETMQIKKGHQLKYAVSLMDELCPSLPTMARGLPPVDNKQSSSSGPAETVMGRCVSAALATGVDCVLAEEFASSREPGRQRGFEQVESDRIAELYKGFKLPQR